MNAYRIFLRIKLIILFRYWKELPITFRLILMVLTPVLLFYLHQIPLDPANKNQVLITLLVYTSFFFMAIPNRNEQILLHNYQIPLKFILLVRSFLLSVPICFIHPFIGLLCMLPGVTLSFLIKRNTGINSKLAFLSKFRYPFTKSSYQWFSFYRPKGMIVYLISLFLLTMGLIHGNDNLSLIALVALGSVYGICAQFQSEPLFFLKVYASPKGCLLKKTNECLSNLMVLLLPVACILGIAGINLLWIGYGILFSLATTLLTLAAKYALYPDQPRFGFIFIILLLIVFVCFGMQQWFTVLFAFSLIGWLYMLAHTNLIKIINGTNQ